MAQFEIQEDYMKKINIDGICVQERKPSTREDIKARAIRDADRSFNGLLKKLRERTGITKK